MKNLQTIIVSLLLCSLFSCQQKEIELKKSDHDMEFSQLASRWDEAVPLGNAMIGALVWQNGDNLRLSLDRADLWDLRPMKNLDTPQWKYKWVYEQWKNDNYHAVQENFDVPYDRNPAPSKIPAAALEFNTKSLGSVDSVRLSIADATCEVNWENGARLLTFVHASDQAGWFRFEGIENGLQPVIVPPAYNLKGESDQESPVTGQDLRRLGYPKGDVINDKNQITYNQEGWGDFKYQVHVSWKQKGDVLEGCWSISSEFPGWEKTADATEVVKKEQKKGLSKAFVTHRNWWNNFWSKSSVTLPDPILEQQWYLEQYKFGSAARKGAPPISLQAVWTADNGKLPPWKGDFHHDLNTQLSYWPAYSGNHLDLEEGYLDWLLKYKDTFKKYTKDYYETNGLNVPGVTTLTGAPMGGWIQYSFGPTVSAWLAQHFYLHWRYSMDRQFLEEKAYPWITEVAIHLDELSVKDKDGMRKLPISSSPEINDNSRSAWFGQTTNFDLALIRWTFEKAAEVATELGKTEESNKWRKVLAEWPDFATNEATGLMFTPTLPYHQSHRHFSHLMAIHPLGLIDWSQGDEAQQLITKTIENLKTQGSDWWTGYSFSWLGNLQARMMDGEGAAETLRIFANNFCLQNTFHVNGEQHNKGYSKFKYRPFTLEGNFAFASAIQEMLIQSHTGIVKIFPAIPTSWKNISFDQLRTEGAFLISAEKKNGEVTQITIEAAKDGEIRMENPFTGGLFTSEHPSTAMENIITMKLQASQKVILKAK